MSRAQAGRNERLMIDVVEPNVVWCVPFDPQQGADYAQGDCSFIRFDSKDEAWTYVQGYVRGLIIRNNP